jgi:hypothetical protein
MDELTSLVVTYKETGKYGRELTEKTALLVYSLLKQRSGIDADDLGDFFCYFYPKIPRLFHRFTYQGKSFRHYLLSSLKWQFRTFITCRKKKIRRELFLEREYLWNPPYWEDNITVCEKTENITAAAKDVLDVDEKGKITNPVLQKRLILLAMKGSVYIDTHMADCVSIITGYTSDWILNCIQHLKEEMHKRSSRLEQLRVKRNKYYIQIYDIHIDLSYEENSQKRNVLFQELFTVKNRMEQTIIEIKKIPRSPTHREIAQVMGMPKGTVDSGLYYLKNAFENVYRTGQKTIP